MEEFDLEFDFDCPKYYINLIIDNELTNNSFNEKENNENMEWFSVLHPKHEPEIRTTSSENFSSSERNKVTVPLVHFNKKQNLTSRKRSILEKPETLEKVDIAPTKKLKSSLQNNHITNINQNNISNNNNNNTTINFKMKNIEKNKNLSKGNGNMNIIVNKSTNRNTSSIDSNINKIKQKKSTNNNYNSTNNMNQDFNEKEMLNLLRRHNEKFVPAPLYEPPKHSVRDIRQWEKKTGKLWCNLKPQERELVNEEISKCRNLR